MSQISTETHKQVVRQHVQDGRTLTSLAAEYGLCKAHGLTMKNAKQIMFACTSSHSSGDTMASW